MPTDAQYGATALVGIIALVLGVWLLSIHWTGWIPIGAGAALIWFAYIHPEERIGAWAANSEEGDAPDAE